MTSVIFDPDARAEFLSDVQYYENCYSIEPDHIYIAAVAHAKRKPGYWLIRVKDTEENPLTHP
jgi:hypothetical protein